MSNWSADVVDDVDRKADIKNAEVDKETEAKKEALIKTKESQQTALSTARARAAASGGTSSTLADYFTSTQKMFDRENQWLASSNVRSSVVGAHAEYYDSAAKQPGFGFLSTGKKDWWA